MVRQNYSGIDISNSWFDIHILVTRAGLAARFEQGVDGFQALDTWLAENNISKLRVAMEHTGGYEIALAKHLVSRGHRVSVVDGRRISRYKEGHRILGKTDAGDARALAWFSKERKPEAWAARPDPYATLLELWRHRQNLVDSVTAWSNRRAAPKTNEFVQAQKGTLIEVLRLSIEQVEQQIREHIASEGKLLRSHELLTSIKAIGEITAAGVLAEAGPLESYPTPESLVMAAGLAPLPVCSGSSVKGIYRKPYGNANLRRCLSLTGSNARRFNPAMRQFAERILARPNKSTRLVNRAVTRKLLHIMWGVIHRQEPFDPSKSIQSYVVPQN